MLIINPASTTRQNAAVYLFTVADGGTKFPLTAPNMALIYAKNVITVQHSNFYFLTKTLTSTDINNYQTREAKIVEIFTGTG